MPSVKSFFNPFSSEHQAISNFGQSFGKYSAGKKALTIFLSFVGLLGFGVGAVAVFRKLTYTFSAKNSEDSSTIKKTNTIGSNALPKIKQRKIETLPKEELKQILNDKNFSLNAKMFEGNSTYLHVICQTESLEVINSLVTREDANFETQNNEGFTPEIILAKRIQSNHLEDNKKIQADSILNQIILKTKNPKKIAQEILCSKDLSFLEELLKRYQELTHSPYTLKCYSKEPELIYALVKNADNNDTIKGIIRFFGDGMLSLEEPSEEEIKKRALEFLEAISDTNTFPNSQNVQKKIKKAFNIN